MSHLNTYLCLVVKTDFASFFANPNPIYDPLNLVMRERMTQIQESGAFGLAKSNNSNLQQLVLDTLHYCMKVDTSQALEAGAMEVFTMLLAHGVWEIRGKAARDIMDLR